MRSGRGVSAFPVGLLGEPLPGLRHFLHNQSSVKNLKAIEWAG